MSEQFVEIDRFENGTPTESHKLCAALLTSLNINYRLSSNCITIFVPLRHIKIKIIHGSHNLLCVLTWVGRILVLYKKKI